MDPVTVWLCCAEPAQVRVFFAARIGPTYGRIKSLCYDKCLQCRRERDLTGYPSWAIPALIQRWRMSDDYHRAVAQIETLRAGRSDGQP